MEYSYNDFLNDPFNKLHGVDGPKSKEWNEYQRGAKMNALELKYPYSREQLVRLAAVKRGIYNPILPTLRKIDRDDVLCKLSDEHARHTTYVDRSDIKSTKLYLNYPRGREPLISKSLSDLWDTEDKGAKKEFKARKNSSIKRRDLITFDFTVGPHQMAPDTQESVHKMDDLRKVYGIYKKEKVHDNISMYFKDL